MMHQIVLIDSASREMSLLDKLEQLDLVSHFSKLRKDPLQPGQDGVGEIRKGSRTMYRSRFKEYRIYFEKKNDQLIVHHVLHKNTLQDFFIRSNLDILQDEEFQETSKFWKYIEQRQMQLEPAQKG
jgi:mRNA interferase RelE/StbE